jgi:hypothetical protein
MDKLLVAFFLLNSVNLFCQPEGLTKKKIADNGIYKVTAFLDMESDDLQFENMDVRFFKFNQASKCIYKKLIYPFYDFVRE